MRNQISDWLPNIKKAEIMLENEYTVVVMIKIKFCEDGFLVIVPSIDLFSILFSFKKKDKLIFKAKELLQSKSDR